MRRLLELRRFPLLAGAELAELAMLAENVVETSYPSGAIVAAPSTLDEIHLILTGQIDVGSSMIASHEAFGVLEVLGRRPLAVAAMAVGPTRTLRLKAGDLREVLEDSFGLLVIAIRELAARTLALHDAGPPCRPFAAAIPVAGPLGLVERMMVLRHQVPFALAAHGAWPDGLGRSAPLEAIALLAHASKETTWPAGAAMVRAGDPAHNACFLLDGTVRATREDRAPCVIGPGGAVGVIESLAGVPHTDTIEVVAPVRALEVAGSVVFDVLEDHMELGLSMLEALASALLDAMAADAARVS